MFWFRSPSHFTVVHSVTCVVEQHVHKGQSSTLKLQSASIERVKALWHKKSAISLTYIGCREFNDSLSEWLPKAIICSWMTVSSFVYDRMPRIFSHRVKPSTFSSVVTWCFSLITQFRASASLRSIECCIIRSRHWLAPHTPPRRSKALYFFRPGLPDAQYGVDTEMVMTSTCRSDAKRWFYLLKVIN